MIKEKNKWAKSIFLFILILMFSFLVSSVNSTNQSNSTNISNIFTAENQTITNNISVNSVKEQIKCTFKNSNETQKCYADTGEFGCSGKMYCIVNVSGEKGEKLRWKSSCGDYQYSTIDGENENIFFDCTLPKWAEEVQESEENLSLIEERVKCTFKNSNETQKCYSAENVLFYCEGKENCIAKIKGKANKKIIWKSSCGGYAYTILDGNEENAVFDCLPEGKISFENIKKRGFRHAYWKCYNGEEMKKGSEQECLLSEIWKAYANKFCWDKCKENKCGVDSFAVFDECYYDETVNDFNESIKEYLQESTIKKEVLVCKDACPFEGKCYQFGHRKNGMFCSDEGFFVKQLKAGEKCENNWECSSNVCVSGKCVSEGLIQKIISWFKKLFGGEEE